MTWFKVDDGFWSHPKTSELSDSAIALWTKAGAYCCQHLTDGAVVMKTLRLLGRQKAAHELVSAGLWEETEDGWKFHDWHEYQETSETVKTRRSETRKRVQKWRASHRTNPVTDAVSNSVTDYPCNSVTNGVRNSVSNAPPRPDPTRPDHY